MSWPPPSWSDPALLTWHPLCSLCLPTDASLGVSTLLSEKPSCFSLLLKPCPPWPRLSPLSRLPCLGAGSVGSGAQGVGPLPGGPGPALTRGTSSPGCLPSAPQGEGRASSSQLTLEPEQRRDGEDGRKGGRGFMQVLTPPLPSSSSSPKPAASRRLEGCGPPRLLLCSGMALASQPGLQEGTLCPPAWGLDPSRAAPSEATGGTFSPPPWAAGPGGCVHLPREQGGTKRPGAGPGARFHSCPSWAPCLPTLSPFFHEAGCPYGTPTHWVVLLFSHPSPWGGHRPEASSGGPVWAGAHVRLSFPLWDFQAGRQAA